MALSEPILIRNLEVHPPLFLAPMAGLTHSALRTTILSCGKIGLLSTEMLAAWRVPYENPTISPFLVRSEKEKPLSYQLLLNQPEMVGPAIEALHKFGADSIDFNLGCPAPRVRRAGGGSMLAAKPDLVREIVKKARQCTRLPLSAKIRLGEILDEENLRDFCSMLEGEGIDYLTVHARLDRESFNRRPKWEWVGKVKQWVSIPVIANGGIESVETAGKCLEESGADGLMIGRAAAVKPWIFAEIAEKLYGVQREKTPSLPTLYHGFCEALIERFREERRLGRLKEFTHYFAANYQFGHHLASRVQSCQTMADAVSTAGDFFRRSDEQGYEDLKALQKDTCLF